MSERIVVIKVTVDQAAYLKRLVLDDQKVMEDQIQGVAMDPLAVPQDVKSDYLMNEAIRQIL